MDNDYAKKLIEILNQTNQTNNEGFSKIAGRLEAFNERVNDCFETFRDLDLTEKEKTAAIKQIASLMSDGGLSHDICLGVRHGLFGQGAQSDASLYDLVNALNLPLSQLVSALDTLIEVQSLNGKHDDETGK